MIKEQYGKINPEWMVRTWTAHHQTGNLHIAVYDFPNDIIYLAGASPVDKQGNFLRAYERPFVKVDLLKLWSQAKPLS
jgi:hypothetical protein